MHAGRPFDMKAKTMTTRNTTTLTGYVHALTAGEAVPIPDEGETHAEKLERIRLVRIAGVDEETYWHFLEVLPPRWMGGGCFCFAEGVEPLWLFWQQGKRYFCRRLSWNETREFCDLAGIRRHYYLY